jgi:transmembrane sensor
MTSKTMVRRTFSQIERIAAEWVARRDGGLSKEAESAFREWLAADPRHLGAYARAEALLAQLERVGAAGADALRAGALQHASSSLAARLGMTRRRAIWGGSSAAGLAAAASGLVWLPLLTRESYSTALGETREVVLSDGSLLTLNTGSKVLIHYSKEERRIVLMAGEALFDVAKNRQRPFLVTAGDTQIRALGTSFTVKLLPQEPIRVLVREGHVEVKRPQVPEAAPVELSANTIAVAPAQAPISIEKLTSAQVKRDLAWREGRIAFDNETLAQAARAFSRYSDIRILVSADVENQTVTGLYVTNDPVGFAKAAALSLGLRAEIERHEIRLSRAEGAGQ